jgi:uncharacterized damage-inducible protein DinB
MDRLETIRRLWEHALWADARMLEALLPHAASAPEARREFAHILGAEETWLARLERRTPRAAVWPEAAPEDLRPIMDRIHAAYRAYLAALGDSDLSAPVAYTNSAGQPFTNAVADVLLQAALHGQYHRGKVSLLLRQAGRAPAPVDFIAFVRGVPAATEATGRDAPRHSEESNR